MDTFLNFGYDSSNFGKEMLVGNVPVVHFYLRKVVLWIRSADQVSEQEVWNCIVIEVSYGRRAGKSKQNC